MANRPKPNSGKRPANSAAVLAQAEWFGASADATVEQLRSWDVKQERLVAAILGVLQAGRGIGFGSSWDGDAIIITIYDGGAKIKRKVYDSVEFDTAVASILSTLPKLTSDLEGGH